MVIVEALVVGLLIGAVLGLIGAGGAIVAVPAFLYLFGFGALEATTASLAVVGASAFSGMLPRLRAGQVDVRHGLSFWLLGIAGTFGGSVLANVLPSTAIVVGFAAVMMAASVAMWRKSSGTTPAQPHRRPWWVLLLVSLGIGLLTGLFGVGGGFLIVPALVLVFGFPFGMATGTSLLVIALNSATALVFKAGTWAQIDWQVPLLVIGGGLIGSALASHFHTGIPQRVLERSFAVVLVLLAAWMAIESLVIGGTS